MSVVYLDGLAAYAVALETLIDSARERIQCFDRDLRLTGLESPACVARLADFLAVNPRRSLVILLHDTDHLMRDCPRLLDLHRRRSQQMPIHLTAEHHRMQMQVFVIADGRHLATRFHADQPRGKLALDEPSEAAYFSAQFETLIQASSLATGIGILGI